MAEMAQVQDDKPMYLGQFKEFFHQRYKEELTEAAATGESFAIDFAVLEKFSPTLAEALLKTPDEILPIIKEAVKQIDLPQSLPVHVTNLPDHATIGIRDLRSVHIGQFVQVEGVIRRASEIRPELMSMIYECTDCNMKITVDRRGTFIGRPFQCDCGNRKFTESSKQLVDMRWLTIEEPFELTEGERPSQVTVVLKDDLVNMYGRRITEPGNRLRLTGVLRDIPKGKQWSVKLDFYLDADHADPTEIGWERVQVSSEEEEEIKNLAKDPQIFEKLIGSLAPSLYGMEEIKEAIILQFFGGVPRTLADKTKFRGDIHVLLLGDPSSGKSQLLKLAPQIVPRGRYVSGKGATAVGLTAGVTKDEQFMGGWVLEAGAMVLSNKGLLSIDEFEKMSIEDQVAMHEAMEQGSVSIAKASIVATLPAQTSVLAGGNPKFSRFDPYMPISKQITIPDTLLSRFDLRFILRDVPDAEKDTLLVDHVLTAREDDQDTAVPRISTALVRKYVSYAREKVKPKLTKETGKLLRNFYIKMRRKAEGGNAPVPITLRQFEAMIRLSEAAAKVQLSELVKPEHAQRAIRLMRYSLQQVGYDPETGTIDIDKAEGAQTSSADRSKIRVITDIINKLSERKKEIAVGEIIEEARKAGIEGAEEYVEKLTREGMLFEPSPGYVQKV
ncbi:MAG: minichromosome maintenance protein MCM [Nanoarchaeota archaeon]|nr:minichromosome maintenance protein MCM [Nanoarchaeota archaeon]